MGNTERDSTRFYQHSVIPSEGPSSRREGATHSKHSYTQHEWVLSFTGKRPQ